MSIWSCPSCQQVLLESNSSWQCASGHTFDKAKEGYVNLLLAQNKRSKSPGDSKEMILARREFLQRGFYQPLANKIAELIHSHVSQKQTIALFDAGCGEGYYLNSIKQSLLESTLIETVLSFGCDISKVGIQKAAKSYSDSKFCVASTFDLPLANAKLDAVIQVFAPSSAAEVARVLNNSGVWIRVNPAKQHLNSLKSFLYDDAQQHQLVEDSFENFEEIERAELQFDLYLKDPKSRLDLLKMTPYFWSSTEKKRASFIQDCEHCLAHFDIQILRKRNE